MNSKRRKGLRDACNHLNIAVEVLEDIVSEEQDCLDNTPENLQESEAYADREDMIDGMQDAIDDIKSSVDTLSEML